MEPLRTLTYSSVPAPGFDELALARLGVQSRRNNAIDGLTGLLVFNGSRFSQTIEGAARAIEALMARLCTDPRHSGIHVSEDRELAQRLFPSWDMHVLQVDPQRDRALEQVERQLLGGAEPGLRRAVRATFDLCFG